MKKNVALLTALLLSSSLMACPASGGDVGQQVQYEVTGVALDGYAQPIAGVKIIVDNTVEANSAVTGLTGTDGRYRLKIPKGSWRVYAELKKTFNGRTYTFDLHPNNPTSFAAADGAVRDFNWRLWGEKPAPLVGKYGGTVYVKTNPDTTLKASQVELTLEPIGTLIDGSNGQPLIGKPVGGLIEDVPIGRYRITAQYVPDGEPPTPLQVRLVQVGTNPAFQNNIIADFEPESFGVKNAVRFEVTTP